MTNAPKQSLEARFKAELGSEVCLVPKLCLGTRREQMGTSGNKCLGTMISLLTERLASRS
jgi:hypothetical protein